jgi:hypothetical protein
LRNISELNMLLRAQAELPVGLKVTTDEFREGWKFVRTTNAKRLEKKIQTHGWNFIRIADGSLRSGIGETSQQAISGALKLALRRVNERFNAVEVEHIEITRYPWFFLARVRVYPYLLQQGAEIPEPDEAVPSLGASRQDSLPPFVVEPFPPSNSAMPTLGQKLVSSQCA